MLFHTDKTAGRGSQCSSTPCFQVLLFPSNLFSGLSWSSFQIFPEIYEIDLTNNKVPVHRGCWRAGRGGARLVTVLCVQVPEVTPGGAPVLPGLRVLRLGSNLLTALPDGSFSACPGLTELYLQENAIGALGDRTFSGLSQLEVSVGRRGGAGRGTRQLSETSGGRSEPSMVESGCPSS